MSVLGWWVPRSDGNLECQPSKQSPLDPRDKKPGSLGQGSKTYKRGAREKYDPFQRRRRREILGGGPSKPNLMQLFRLPSHALFLPAAAVEPVRPRCAAKLRAVHSFTVHSAQAMLRAVHSSSAEKCNGVERRGLVDGGGRHRNICFSFKPQMVCPKDLIRCHIPFHAKVDLDSCFLGQRSLFFWQNGSEKLVLKKVEKNLF